MILLVSIIHVLVCISLLLIILLQPGRGNGLAGAAFGGGDSSSSVFGTKTADVLTKVTTGVAITFIVTCIGLSALTANKSRSLYSDFQNQAPITMEQVQNAVKEAEVKATANADSVSEETKQAVDDIVKSAQTTAAESVPAA